MKKLATKKAPVIRSAMTGWLKPLPWIHLKSRVFLLLFLFVVVARTCLFDDLAAAAEAATRLAALVLVVGTVHAGVVVAGDDAVHTRVVVTGDDAVRARVVVPGHHGQDASQAAAPGALALARAAGAKVGVLAHGRGRLDDDAIGRGGVGRGVLHGCESADGHEVADFCCQDIHKLAFVV